ncbi:hypothetical protein [Paenarthrobacter nitroguajacolicus]|uniref:hypothetical protein n=1 Tax=Paenarthrobacter nitroguajacolicus TaxID=211146 RepID=UPI000A489006|nr:hypothetical protein [Paenarthrobacter nitroguajacolicus]
MKTKKENGRQGELIANVLVAAMMTAVFVAMAWESLPAASVIFAVAAGYAFLMFRVVAHSGRAAAVMFPAMFLIFYSLTCVDDYQWIAAPGSWFLGLIVGGIAGINRWSGKSAGTKISRKPTGAGEGGLEFPGGLRLAIINASCAGVLLAAGIAHLVLQKPTASVGAVFAGATLGGWALFRFPLSLKIRNLLLWVIPVEFILLFPLAENTSQTALPFVWAYGVLGGILLGGRYWSGPRLGEPRPPFNVRAKTQRKRKRKPRTQQNQNKNSKTSPSTRGAVPK